jgi:hypothetical protein
MPAVCLIVVYNLIQLCIKYSTGTPLLPNGVAPVQVPSLMLTLLVSVCDPCLSNAIIAATFALNLHHHVVVVL